MDTQLQPCMMAYRSLVLETTGATLNLLMLGRQVEELLDLATETTTDAEPLTTEYAGKITAAKAAKCSGCMSPFMYNDDVSTCRRVSDLFSLRFDYFILKNDQTN